MSIPVLENFRKLRQYRESCEHFNPEKDKWGIVLVNMGGPEKIEDIREFLYNIFSDANIIELPLSKILQKPLAKLISNRRTKKVIPNYEAIGGGSPLLKWSQQVAGKVQIELRENFPNCEVILGMRYTRPFLNEALNHAAQAGWKHCVILSMYPQYCHATTGSALIEMATWIEKEKPDFGVSLIADWYDKEAYIKLLRDRLLQAVTKLPSNEPFTVIFSAHSLPVKLVERGDPYLPQVKKTVAEVGDGYDYRLTFQSRSGPVKWQEPETVAMIKELGGRGVKNMVVVPVSFVSDHIETLHEIDIELKHIANEAGIKNFVRTESFNDSKDFIAFLTNLINSHVRANEVVQR